MECLKCNSSWESNSIISNCPFCNAFLPMQYEVGSLEWKILNIVKLHTPDIYNHNTEFNKIVGKHFVQDAQDDMGRLLKIIIFCEGAKAVFSLKDANEEVFKEDYNKIIAILSKKSFIQKSIITPAVNLLCFGLGISHCSQNFKIPHIVEVQPRPKIKYVTSINDFKVKNGVLIKYIGNGGEVVIPDTITEIGQNAFDRSQKLTCIKIPSSVKKIGISAFHDCKNLNKVILPSTLSEIMEFAFEDCQKLTEIEIPESVKIIRERTFGNCWNLNKITLPEKLTSISDRAFYNCSNLSSITIGDYVSSIGNMAFENCVKLSSKTKNTIKQINPKSL